MFPLLHAPGKWELEELYPRPVCSPKQPAFIHGLHFLSWRKVTHQLLCTVHFIERLLNTLNEAVIEAALQQEHPEVWLGWWMRHPFPISWLLLGMKMSLPLTALDISSVLLGECTIKCHSVDVSFWGGWVISWIVPIWVRHKSEHRHINKWLSSHKDQAAVMLLDIAGYSSSKISQRVNCSGMEHTLVWDCWQKDCKWPWFSELSVGKGRLLYSVSRWALLDSYLQIPANCRWFGEFCWQGVLSEQEEKMN